jgi:hypothetical protein
MNQLAILLLLCVSLFFMIGRARVHADTCLHNEGTRCTQVRSANEVSGQENEHCQQTCVRTGHVSGHCSVSSNCFQFCLCQQKDL